MKRLSRSRIPAQHLVHELGPLDVAQPMVLGTAARQLHQHLAGKDEG